MGYQWINDGHKVLVILDGDTTHPQVHCPAVEVGHRVEGLMCGMGTTEAKGAPNFCVVEEVLPDLHWEGNITGLKIMVRDFLMIEYAWEDEDTLIWKVAGYPTWEEIKRFREEAISALNIPKGIRLPAEMFAMLPLKPWSETDDEVKYQLAEDLQLHVENETRRKEPHASKNR